MNSALMNWLSIVLMLTSIPVVLLILWLLGRPIYRGLWIPKSLRNASRICGRCGQGCPEQLPDRCSECGSFYATVGIQTPALLAKTREGLAPMLISFTLLCIISSLMVWGLTLAVLPAARATPMQWQGSVSVAGAREHIWDREATADDQNYSILIDANVIGEQGKPPISATYSMTIEPGNGPSVLVQWTHADNQWTAQGNGEQFKGSGFARESLERLFREANLDPEDPRVSREIDQFAQIMSELDQDPIELLAYNGLWSRLNGITNPMNSMAAIAPQPDPVLDVSFPWTNGSSSGYGGNERSFELVYYKTPSAPLAATPFGPTGFQQDTPDVTAQVSLRGDQSDYTSMKFKSFEVTLNDRSGWPVKVIINTKTPHWSLVSDPELGRRTGDTLDGEVWKLAWADLGRDPEDEDEAQAVAALQTMLQAAIDNKESAWMGPHDTEMMTSNDFEEPDPALGGLTNGYGGGGSSWSSVAGMSAGYIPPHFIAGFIVAGVFLVLWVIGTILMIRRRRKLFRAFAPVAA